MIKKFIAKLFGIISYENVCKHSNSTTKKIKYCLDCNKVIQEY